MPTTQIVADNYIDDPNRSTEEVQDALNGLFDFARETEAELAALSGTRFKEGAVRNVGSDDDELPDNAELNSRLEDYQLSEDLAPVIANGQFDPSNATLVWTGSMTTPNMSQLSEQGDGMYILKPTPPSFYHWVYVHKGSASAGSVRATRVGFGDDTRIENAIYRGVAFQVSVLQQGLNLNPLTIEEIYKV